MRFESVPAERFLSYADGERPLEDVWQHPAYGVARDHAELLGRTLQEDDVEAAMDGDETTFRHAADLADNRGEVESLLEHVDARESDWVGEAERQLARITPDEDLSDVPVYLAIGYEFGIGTRDGAFVNLNEPLFFEDPRQLLYVAVHESSHVVYDRVHGYSDEFGPDDLASQDGQRRAFETLFHTEAYATYTPLAMRRSDGNLGTHDHLVCSDYTVLGDDARLADSVAEYDAFRERLREGSVDPETLLNQVFGEPRLPYRVGPALLDRLERTRGIDAVREGFYLDPAAFLDEFDGVLDEYRPES